MTSALVSATRSHRKKPDPNVNAFFVFFGQFVDHDLSNSLAKNVQRYRRNFRKRQ